MKNPRSLWTGVHGYLKYERSNVGHLLVLDTMQHKPLFDLNLESAPVWDGMAAAYGKLFISCNDGTIQCYGK